MKKVKYTKEEFQKAYKAWIDLFETVNKPDPKCEARNEAWDHYCDIRDGLVLGTTRRRRFGRETKKIESLPVTHH